jgi:hypothetical protein
MKDKKVQIAFEDWKFCALVDLGIANDDDQNIQFSNHLVRIFKPSDKQAKGFFVAEVYSMKSTYVDHETAFHGSNDILKKVLTRISIGTLRISRITSAIGVTQFKAEKNKEFKMLLSANFITPPKSKSFSAGDHINLFTSIDDNDLNDAVSEFGIAVNTSSIYHKFLHYYNCIEGISRFLTTEKAKNICKSCGEVNELDFYATGNTMKGAFDTCGYDKKTFNECRALRGKIAHGAGQKSKKVNDTIFKLTPAVEKVAIDLLKEYTPLQLTEGEIVSKANNQFVEVIGKKIWRQNLLTNAAYHVVSHNFKFDMSIQKTGDPTETEGFITEHLPMKLSPFRDKIFPYAWPY